MLIDLYFFDRLTTDPVGYSLAVMLWDSSENYREATYDAFSVGAAPGFILDVSGFNSTEGYRLYDGLSAHANGMNFSTHEDNDDQDGDGARHCAKERKSAGW